MVEQQTFNLLVVGSSPTGPTTKMNQHFVDSITGLQNRSSNTEASIKGAFSTLLEIMIVNKLITRRQANVIKKQLDK